MMEGDRVDLRPVPNILLVLASCGAVCDANVPLSKLAADRDVDGVQQRVRRPLGH